MEEKQYLKIDGVEKNKGPYIIYTPDFRSGQFRLRQVMSTHVKSDLVRSGQDRTDYFRSFQVRLGHI